MFTVLFNEHHAISLTQQEKLKLGFYLLIEYIFYMSMLFGLARQILLYVASQQSQAISLMAMYQPIILIGAAYIAIWLTWVHYQDTLMKYTRQKAIFSRLCLKEQVEAVQSQYHECDRLCYA